MRGLDARCTLGRAKLMMPIDAEAAVDILEVAYGEAYVLGESDYRHGATEVPYIFLDEPLLLKGWKMGRDDAQVSQFIGELENL